MRILRGKQRNEMEKKMLNMFLCLIAYALNLCRRIPQTIIMDEEIIFYTIWSWLKCIVNVGVFHFFIQWEWMRHNIFYLWKQKTICVLMFFFLFFVYVFFFLLLLHFSVWCVRVDEIEHEIETIQHVYKAAFLVQ